MTRDLISSPALWTVVEAQGGGAKLQQKAMNEGAEQVFPKPALWMREIVLEAVS